MHKPVMVREVLEFLGAGGAHRLIDGTLGLGGHTAAILEAGPAAVEVLGIDCDGDALARAREELHEFGARVHLAHGRFCRMQEFATELGWARVDGVLLDLGVSSLQLDSAERGFAYRLNGPLDMRLDRRSEIRAAALLNHWSEEELVDMFRRFGEEPQARRIARAVVARRREKPWEHTGEFAALIEATAGRRHNRRHPPATRCFQALRIAVNNELEELRAGLEAAVKVLRPGGRLVVIAFHSLEDRIVKQFFRAEAASCVCPPELPVCVCSKQPTLRILTRRPRRPEEAELQENRRATSARLRAAEKLETAAMAF